MDAKFYILALLTAALAIGAHSKNISSASGLAPRSLPKCTPGSVTELDSHTYYEMIKGGMFIIKFHRATCSLCIEFKPVFIKVAHTCEGAREVCFAEVDCIESRDVCEREDTMRTPKVIWTEGGKQVSRYSGDFSQESVEKFFWKRYSLRTVKVTTTAPTTTTTTTTTTTSTTEKPTTKTTKKTTTSTTKKPTTTTATETSTTKKTTTDESFSQSSVQSSTEITTNAQKRYTHRRVPFQIPNANADINSNIIINQILAKDWGSYSPIQEQLDYPIWETSATEMPTNESEFEYDLESQDQMKSNPSKASLTEITIPIYLAIFGLYVLLSAV